MRRLCTPRWLVVHAGMLIVVAGFLLLGWWQIRRAVGGNALSFGYAVEWPVFAGFVVWVWATEVRKAWRALPHRGEPGGAGVRGAADAGATARARPARGGPAYDDSADPELAAYNRYLEWLNANPHASRRDYPGSAGNPDPTGVTAGPMSVSHEEKR